MGGHPKPQEPGWIVEAPVGAGGNPTAACAGTGTEAGDEWSAAGARKGPGAGTEESIESVNLEMGANVSRVGRNIRRVSQVGYLIGCVGCRVKRVGCQARQVRQVVQVS